MMDESILGKDATGGRPPGSIPSRSNGMMPPREEPPMDRRGVV